MLEKHECATRILAVDDTIRSRQYVRIARVFGSWQDGGAVTVR